MLAHGFPAVERFVDPVQERAMKAAEESVSSPLRIVFSVGTGLVLIAAGVVWGVRPTLPLGGWATGASLILSGIILLALLVVSYRRVKQGRTPVDDRTASPLRPVGASRRAVSTAAQLAQARSTRRRPRPGCHVSTSSALPAAFSPVNTTCSMSARNSSPGGPSAPSSVVAKYARPAIFASPGHRGRIVVRRVRGRTVQGEARVAVQVRRLARTRHRPERQLAVGELGLDPADPRRPVRPQGGDRLVLARVEDASHLRRELRFGLLDLAPGHHGRSMAQTTDKNPGTTNDRGPAPRREPGREGSARRQSWRR